jgi:hypothetical protein
MPGGATKITEPISLLEGKMMVESAKGRELVRLSVKWPLTIETKSGHAHGETRNITGEGMFLYCSDRLFEGIVYSMTLQLPGKPLKVKGRLTWSNLDSCTSSNFNPAMGFYFMRIDEDRDKQIFRAAIIAECKKPLRLQEEINGLPDSLTSGETQVIAHFGGFRKY